MGTSNDVLVQRIDRTKEKEEFFVIDAVNIIEMNVGEFISGVIEDDGRMIPVLYDPVGNNHKQVILNNEEPIRENAIEIIDDDTLSSLVDIEFKSSRLTMKSMWGIERESKHFKFFIPCDTAWYMIKVTKK
jgi:hypothetical protein